MNAVAQTWQRIIQGPEKSWVLFENGTCVILMEPEADLAAQAMTLMREWGPVHPGCSAGDFSVITLENDVGWVVTSHHNDILTYVGPDEVESNPEEVAIGLFGRSKRDRDAESLVVVHIEDRRATP